MQWLAPIPGGIYVDATGGGGGYAREIKRAIGPEGIMIVLDQDKRALGRMEEQLSREGIVDYRHGNFRDIAILVHDYAGRVDGIVADLGLSSDQLEDPSRGFSVVKSGPLDMRMDRENPLTAAEIVNDWPEEKLAQILFDYAEERHSRRIARVIVERRRGGRIATTDALARIVAAAYASLYRGRSRRHPATRVFQALRIAVNDELGALKQLLGQAPQLLRSGGKLAVVSFHSLEDREVKRAFKARPWGALTKKAIRPGESEMGRNPRSRSAKLRVAATGE